MFKINYNEEVAAQLTARKKALISKKLDIVNAHVPFAKYLSEAKPKMKELIEETIVDEDKCKKLHTSACNFYEDLYDYGLLEDAIKEIKLNYTEYRWLDKYIDLFIDTLNFKFKATKAFEDKLVCNGFICQMEVYRFTCIDEETEQEVEQALSMDIGATRSRNFSFWLHDMNSLISRMDSTLQDYLKADQDYIVSCFDLFLVGKITEDFHMDAQYQKMITQQTQEEFEEEFN